MSTIEQTIKELRTQIEEHNYRYYVLAQPTIEDTVFDALMQRLEALEKEYPEYNDPNSPTQRVGSDRSERFVSVEHTYPMLSLSNSYNYDEVRAYWQRLTDLSGISNPSVHCELKFDGLSISVIYIDGNLHQAITRGDGRVGDDVTANVRTIRSIPLRLTGESIPHRVELRGEIVLPFSEFERINNERKLQGEEPFANPRNAASGTLKLLDTSLVSQRKLDCYFYHLYADGQLPDGQQERLALCRSWGVKVSEHNQLASSLEEVYNYIEHWDVARKSLPCATDGVVLKLNSIPDQKRLGTTNKSPRWAIAYKYQPERARTLLKDVSFQVGRTGVIAPVAELEPTLLSGTVVRRATLHNADFIESLDLREGDYVFVEKGGEIIPKIIAVDIDSRSGEKNRILYPNSCPDCGAPLEQKEGEVAIYCTNLSTCPMQIKGRLEHYCSRKAADINIGSETIAALYEKGWLKKIEDFYALRADQLMQLEGFKEKATNNLLRSIEESKVRPYAALLFALGIRLVGETVAKTLAKRFPSIDLLRAASEEELTAIDAVGPKIAHSVVSFFEDEDTLRTLAALKANGILFEEATQDFSLPSSLLLEGKSIVISGTFQHHSREEYAAIIERLGGKKSSSISSKTAFVLAGADMGPSKKKEANSLGIKLLSEDDFLNLIGEK